MPDPTSQQATTVEALARDLMCKGLARLSTHADDQHEEHSEHMRLLLTDHLEQRRMVTMEEAIGGREMQSQYNPGGPDRVNANAA